MDSESRDSLPTCAGCGTYAAVRGCAVCSMRGAEAESRARAIRAVVAAQWGVAIECVLYAWGRRIDDDLWPLFVALKDLPSAEEIVDGVTT